ncbi:MAG: transporter substrate-binding domain-containing protein [Acidimicrobiia bacterium]|nr:transporter substrate-binding domain-containing protein [Acidimicrobiia bacterium]
MRVRRVLGLVAVLALIVTACGDDDATTTTTAATTTSGSSLTQTPGVLTVGSDIPYPPFEDFDSAGNVIGFDADLMTEIASRLDLTVEWVDTDFDTIFTQLATGRFDVVISASTITPERAEQVDFTDPYYKSQQAFTVNTTLTPDVRSTADLAAGDSVAVQTGTTGADWATANLAPNGVEVREFPGVGDAYNAVEAGQVTGVVSDEPSAVAEIANREGIAIVEVIDTNENYGIAVDPARTELLAAINAAFADMLADGTYQAIYDTWFEAPAGSVLYDPRADWPESIVFGFVPSQEAGELQDEIDTFAGILSDALGIEVTGIVSTDYTALGVALGTDQVQMGAFGPAGYVLASRNYDNLELLAQSVRFGDSTYHAQWYTNDPSICGADPVEGAFYYDDEGNVVAVGPTDTPALQVGWNGDGTRDTAVSAGLACPEPVDLSVVVGKTIAFPGETSTSGYIMPTVQLLNAGITDDQYESTFFGGSHDLAVTAVYNGDADIGLSFDDARRAVREDFPDVGEKIIVFNISPRIANDVIAVRADLPQSFKDAIFQAMADYIATDEGAEVMEQLYSWTGLTRANAATLASLEPIGDAIDQLGYGS